MKDDTIMRTTMTKLKNCPFCGGTGKVSFKDYRFIGFNGFGDKKTQYRVQVICNRCRSRGKPIITDGLINPNPYMTEWGNNGMPNSERALRRQAIFAPYVVKAIEAWNRRDGE